jgi:hypothetical protein
MHEHMDGFKLVNMNGSVYNLVLGQFLSPDPFVQYPTLYWIKLDTEWIYSPTD